MMRASWREWMRPGAVVLTAVLLTVGVAMADDVSVERKGKINIVTVDDDGNKHEHTFEFDGDRPRPFLGVMLGGGHGEARVQRVVEDSAAARAGLQAGDLIVAIDGEPVERPWDLTVRILGAEVGDRIDLEVERDGERRTLTAELGESDDWVGAFAHGFDHGKLELQMDKLRERFGEMDFNFDFGPMMGLHGRPRLGVELTHVTPELREHLGGPADAGVLVGRVLPGMPAEEAGVRVGDLIVGVDGEPVEDAGDLIRALRGKSDTSIDLEVVRDGSTITIDVFIPEAEEASVTPGPRA